jgi:hypothetical protein
MGKKNPDPIAEERHNGPGLFLQVTSRLLPDSAVKATQPQGTIL